MIVVSHEMAFAREAADRVTQLGFDAAGVRVSLGAVDPQGVERRLHRILRRLQLGERRAQ